MAADPPHRLPFGAPEALLESDRLHAAVLKFARQRAGLEPGPSESFESLALEIASFQRAQSPGLSRLYRDNVKTIDDIPAVWADAFRLTRVALHPRDLDVARFCTSGTTAAETGVHPQRTLATYDALALILGRETLFRGIGERVTVLCLAQPPPSGLPASSLTHMMRLFVEHFDGRALSTEPEGAAFDACATDRFLVSPQGIDLAGLRRGVRLARTRGETLVLLTTAFAAAALLQALEGETFAPGPTRIMLTGGFKGRIHGVSETQVKDGLARTFGVNEDAILGEYGMTELTSQLYEAWRPSHEAAHTESSWFKTSGPAGLFIAPPWLVVRAVDERTLRPVPHGEPGLARFVDLANVDSTIAVQTMDRVIIEPEGVRLLGRAPSAPPRGCSLPFEGLLRSPSLGVR